MWLALIPAEASRQEVRPAAGSPQTSAQRALLDTYCVGCHNARTKAGGLLLDELDLARLSENAATGEKIVRKLRAGMMPPSGARRPDARTLDNFITSLEETLDRAEVKPAPPGLHRLNRTEYANAIRDLLGLEVDATKLLPPDDSTHGFDNMSNALAMSPALMEAYLSAAGKVSRLALATATASTQTVYPVPEGESQDYHVEGLPFGTRGGLLIRHEFPIDGEYVAADLPDRARQHGQPQHRIRGGHRREARGLRGRRARQAVRLGQRTGRGFAIRTGVETPNIRVKSGLHTIGVTFLETNLAPSIQDLDAPFLRTTIETAGVPGVTLLSARRQGASRRSVERRRPAKTARPRQDFRVPSDGGQQTMTRMRPVDSLESRQTGVSPSGAAPPISTR